MKAYDYTLKKEKKRKKTILIKNYLCNESIQ